MSDQKFIDEMLKAHNEYRGRHQAGPIKINKKLNEFAQKWADNLASKNAFQHSDCKLSDGTRLGENIAMKMSSNPTAYTGQECTDQWYSEVAVYDFKKGGTMNAGHFSQVVWKGSTELGIGKAVTKDGKNIVVASYLPAGNMGGKYMENVFPPKDGKIVLPKKKEPEPMKPVTSGMKQMDIKGGEGQNKSFSKSVKRETTTRTTSDGKKVTTIKETYTYSDGRTEVVERTETTDHNSRLEEIKKNLSSSENSSSSSSSSDEEDGEIKDKDLKVFVRDTVHAHNKYRRLHSAAAIKHNKQLSKIAQQWANHLASTGTFEHSDNKLKDEKLGENIANKWSSTGAEYTGQEVVDQWYSEEPRYEYSGTSKTLSAGHFTQVVWKGSKELGIGKAKSKDGKVYVVANYKPAGNIIGRFKDNVDKPKK